MNRTIMELTARQLLGRRRTLFLGLVALLPVAIALAYRLSGSSDDYLNFTVNGLVDGLIVTVLLPLAALVIGTSVLGAEIEDGTAVYLLSKPIPRWQIIASKLAAASAVTAALVGLSTAVSTLVALGGEPGQGIVPAFTVAVALGSVVYCAAFIFLSILTSRAFVVGLAYVFIWEGLVVGLFSGTRILSIHEYTLGVGGGLSHVSTRIFDPGLGGLQAVALMVVIGALTFWLAVRRLSGWEMGESG